MAKRALIVIDVQNDYISGNLPIKHPPVDLSLSNVGKAMDAASGAGVPVVVIQNILPEKTPIMAKGSVGAELHPVVAGRKRDHFIEKKLPGAFTDTDLDEWLKKNGVDTVAITGYMAHNCDLSTVIQAFHLGYAVEFLSDATGSVPYKNSAGSASAEEIHRVVTVAMQARFAAVLATEEWIACIASGEAPKRDTIFASNQRARGLM